MRCGCPSQGARSPCSSGACAAPWTTRPGSAGAFWAWAAARDARKALRSRGPGGGGRRGRAPARHPRARGTADRVPDALGQHRDLQAPRLAGHPAPPPPGRGGGHPGRPERAGAGRHLRRFLRAAGGDDDRGRRARRQDGVRAVAGALRGAAGRPLQVRLRPAPRVDDDGESPGRHRAADPGADGGDRGMGARAARAMAVDAPALEDPAASGGGGAGGRDGRPFGVSTAAPRAPERIVVRAPNWIGDVVLSLAALRDLRRNFPRARIEVLARPWVADLYRAVAEVDAVGLAQGVRVDADALRGGFDTGVLLPNSFGSALSLWLARVPERWGYATDGRRPLLTRAPRVPERVRGRSQVYYYRAMLAGAGLRVSAAPDVSLSCPPDWARGAGADRLLGAG